MKEKIGVIAIVVALLLGAYGTLRSLPAPINQVITRNIGGSASPDSPFNWASFGGVKYGYGHTDLNYTIATGTPCAYQVTATSTLVSADWKILNTTGANSFEIGIGANSNATTTRLELLAVGSALYGEAVATTSGNKTIANGWIIPPNYWIVFKVATATPGTISWTGSCNAVWHPL